MSERKVNCPKLGCEAQGLDKPPFADELGQEIYEKVSAEAWSQWKDDMMIKVINEYRLNLSDAEHYETLLKQMRLFLNLDAAGAEGLLPVEDAERGQGAK